MPPNAAAPLPSSALIGIFEFEPERLETTTFASGMEMHSYYEQDQSFQKTS